MLNDTFSVIFKHCVYVPLFLFLSFWSVFITCYLPVLMSNIYPISCDDILRFCLHHSSHWQHCIRMKMEGIRMHHNIQCLKFHLRVPNANHCQWDSKYFPPVCHRSKHLWCPHWCPMGKHLYLKAPNLPLKKQFCCNRFLCGQKLCKADMKS